jgi:ketosteroid isomerase-like protein
MRMAMVLLLFAIGCKPPAAEAPTPQEGLMSDSARDKAAIDQAIHNVARAADLRQWDLLLASFADRVELDYGSPERVSGGEIVARWRPLLSAFDSTQHVISDAEIAVTGDRAEVRSTFRATHVMRGAAGGETWVLSGRYEHTLERTPSGWKIARMRMVPAESLGNPALLEVAKARAAAAPAPARSERDRNREVVRAFFAKLEAFDIAGFAELFAPDGRQRMPFSPEGFPDRLDGRAAVFNQYRSMPQSFVSMRFPDLAIVDAADPSTFIATYRGEIRLRSGGDYNNTYLSVFVIRDGQIAELTEYFNPIVLVQAFGAQLDSTFNVKR